MMRGSKMRRVVLIGTGLALSSVLLLVRFILADQAAPTRAGGAPVKGYTAGSKGAKKLEKAYFAAGCFWGVEQAFRQVKGVKATAVGYMGGRTRNPTYEQVCSHTTGHAETVQVEYDPSQVSYDSLLKVFWENHDPTQVDRQGPDFGKQYRSAIFYVTPEQKAAAEASKKKLEASGKYKRPIATEIDPALTFWRAEEYHQQYLEKRGLAGCHL